MLPFERKASPSCIGRAIVVNGRTAGVSIAITLSIRSQPM
jgi:hypothetical protein